MFEATRRGPEPTESAPGPREDADKALGKLVVTTVGGRGASSSIRTRRQEQKQYEWEQESWSLWYYGWQQLSSS